MIKHIVCPTIFMSTVISFDFRSHLSVIKSIGIYSQLTWPLSFPHSIPQLWPLKSCISKYFCFPFRYRTLGHTASQSRISTFYLLLDLMQFFDLCHAGQLDMALDVSFNRLQNVCVFFEVICLLIFPYFLCTLIICADMLTIYQKNPSLRVNPGLCGQVLNVM